MTFILTNKDESGLFIASNTTSLEDFLKTEISVGKHIYCCFPVSHINYFHYQEFNKRRLLSVSFTNGYILHPPYKCP